MSKDSASINYGPVYLEVHMASTRLGAPWARLCLAKTDFATLSK